MPLPLLGIAASAVGRLAGSSLLRGGIGGIARGLAIGAVKDSVEDSEKPRMPLLPPSQDSSEESTNTNINPNLIRQKILNASIEPIRKEKPDRKYIKEVFTYGVNQAKWKAAKEFCANRGWEFQIFTESELGIK